MEENEKLKLDEKYMRAAIKQAQKAYAINETPIGCVIVYEGKIIGRGYNRRNTDKDPLAHAEIKAIRKGNKKMGDWRLEQCTMYVTLEPCQMCAGAIIQSRLTRVVVGCMNPKAGCAGSVLNLLDIKQFNHQAELTTGVLEEECSALMTGFFRELRRIAGSAKGTFRDCKRSPRSPASPDFSSLPLQKESPCRRYSSIAVSARTFH